MNRRGFLISTLLGLSSRPLMAKLASDYRFSTSPFTLGIASGDVTDSSAVLWTRLAPEPLEGDGGMLDALMDYHYKEEKKDGRITSVIDHGFASHFCDAFGYFAEAILSGRMMESLTKRGIGRAKSSLGRSMRG